LGVGRWTFSHFLVSTDLAQLANDRYEVADALHRYAFGLDQGDADSLASALTEDCVFDFRPAGKKLQLDFPKISGRQAILDSVLPLIGPLDTSHTAPNLQIEINDDSATARSGVSNASPSTTHGPRATPRSSTHSPPTAF
jgi:hypothetical protein